MKTRTKISSLLIALILVLSTLLVACGTDDPAETESETKSVCDISGHTYKDEITTMPTEKADGVKTYTCTVCDHSYTESISYAEITAGATESGDADYAYKTMSGDLFGASGTFNAELGSFTFASADPLVITPAPSFTDQTFYNKFIISYKSSSALKVIITYSDGVFDTGDGGTPMTDIIYLESGKHTFSLLSASYLYGKYAKDLTSIAIYALEGESAEFTLYDIATESINTLEGGSSYIQILQNSRYELGIKLGWGGGIYSLVDFEDGIEDLSTLINCSDAGRLVQQSYYGTSDPSEYTLGEFQDVEWGYNPVQGGSKNNYSLGRLIDYELSEDGTSLYIKAQPCDWANHGNTPSYMENVYTIYSDRIQVDNRFIDFAGYKNNPSRHQELPAFYTVSYLDSFTFYNGTDSWTGGELTVKSELNNWHQNSEQFWAFKEGNTETWCAWYNSSSSDPAKHYGVGVYTPNADVLYAGRNEYNGSTDPRDGACGYVAPLTSFKIVNYKAIEYSYLITTGSVDEIRSTFTEYKDFAANEDLHSKDFGYVNTREPRNPIKGVSYDTFTLGSHPVNQNYFMTTDGSSVTVGGATVSNINKTSGSISIADLVHSTPLHISGWIGYLEAEIEGFSYYFDGNTEAKVSSEAMTPEDAVVSDQFGGQFAKRFLISADTSSLSAGAHTLTFCAELANGDTEILTEWEFTMLEKGEGGDIGGDVGGEDCEHGDFTFAADGSLVCGKCEGGIVPKTYATGSMFSTLINSQFSTPDSFTINPEGYITVSGASTHADPGMDTRFAINHAVGRYLVLKYRTSEDGIKLRLVTYSAVPEVGHISGVAGEWQVVLVDLMNASGGIFELRCNIGGSENVTTDVSHIISFDDLEDAEAYAHELSLSEIGRCFAHESFEMVGDAANSIRCTVCGLVSTPETYQSGAQMGNAVDASNSDNDGIVNNGELGITVNGLGTGVLDTHRVSFIAESGTTYGQHVVLVYKTNSESRIIAVTLDGEGNFDYRDNLPVAESVWSAYCYAQTGSTLDRLELLLNCHGTADTFTSIYGIVTFDSLIEAEAYCQYLQTVVHILG